MEDNMTLVQLAKAVYNKQIPTNYALSLTDMEGTLRDKFRDLVPKGNYNAFQQNKWQIFSIIQEVTDDILPIKIRDRIGAFAEVRSVAQGDKIRFNLKKGRKNVKRFITKVGLAGVYERVRLDRDYIELSMEALGGACYIEFEQYLDGQFDFTDLTNMVIDQIEDSIYEEIYNELIACFAGLLTPNKATVAGFDAAQMNNLIATVGAYGVPNIFCLPTFAATITPEAAFVGDIDKAEKRDRGYIGKYNGANIIVIPQSFEDETNATNIFEPEYAFIIPSSEERIVKVGFEGQLQMRDIQNADWSLEVQMYKKYGCTILSTNQFAMYRNTSL